MENSKAIIQKGLRNAVVLIFTFRFHLNGNTMGFCPQSQKL